jgi:NAD(P)-dependent dehydrogenase (short-subunit alcohol dehydrogenase family)
MCPPTSFKRRSESGMEIDSSVAVVTGAGNGIGAAIAEKLFAEGAYVSLWDVSFESVQMLARRLDPTGDRTAAFKVDVTVEKEVLDGVQQTLDKFARIDVLVNNAGISRHKPIEEMSVELFQQVLSVNLTGPFICCKAVVPVMKKQNRGKIVNIASLGGRTGRPGVGANYAASKAGLIGMTKSLARELGGSNICVNAICPGPILTEQTRQYSAEVFASWNVGRAVPKDGMPSDVADAVIFLSSRRSDWVTGISLDVNGGIYIN